MQSKTKEQVYKSYMGGRCQGDMLEDCLKVSSYIAKGNKQVAK